MTAGIAYFLLGRKPSNRQWIVLVNVTCVVTAFSAMAGSGGAMSFVGLFLGLISMVFGTLGAVSAECVMGSTPYPITMQIAQNKIGSLVIYTMYIIIFCTVRSGPGGVSYWSYFPFGGPGGGWDHRVLIYLAVAPLNEWLTLLIVKMFDSTWKALSSAIALVMAYTLRCFVSLEKGKSSAELELTRILLVLILMLTVTCYSSVNVKPVVWAQEAGLADVKRAPSFK